MVGRSPLAMFFVMVVTVVAAITYLHYDSGPLGYINRHLK